MRILALLLLILSPAAEAARMSLVGVANSSTPHTPGVEYTGETSYGAGILLEGRFVPMVGFEIGAIYAPRKFSYSTAVPQTTTVTSSAKVYEFPAALRFHLGRVFSLGFGGYYAMAKGNITQETSSASGSSTQNVTFASQSQVDSDYGLLGSAQLAFRFTPLTHLVFDARYLLGLKNNSTIAGSDRKYNDFELLAGLQLGF
jgi:hypothetical protein